MNKTEIIYDGVIMSTYNYIRPYFINLLVNSLTPFCADCFCLPDMV